MNKKESAILRGEYDNEDDDYTTCRAYDDCTVALIGKRYNCGVDGYDVYARDLFGLDNDSGECASDKAKERLMKLTKKDMVDLIGESVSIMLRFQAFYVRYQLMTQTFERIRGVNMETLNLMKDINAAYENLAPELERNCRYGRYDYEYMYINRFMETLKKTDLLVIDEIGFISLHKEASELLFQVISDCYERKSLIITSNLEFSQWNGVFVDDRLTAALIDRLIRHSHIVVFSGESYRLRQSILRRKPANAASGRQSK